MTKTQLKQLFKETDFVHFSGTEEELKVANTLKAKCEEMGVEAHIEPFRVPYADVKEAHVYIDGVEIPSEGCMCCGSGEVEAEIYYMPLKDRISMAGAKDKIVLLDDAGIIYFNYQDLMKAGAKGILFTYGNVRFNDNDIEKRELREYVVGENRKVLAAEIHTKDAVKLLKKGSKTAKIVIDQHEHDGESRNVVATLPGERPEYITLTAHYDTTSSSHGAYDNMSGCAGLLGVMEYFTKHRHSYGLKFVFCGSEERGLLGSKAYVRDHEAELEDCALNINLDMIGLTMGSLKAIVTAEDKLAHYLTYMGAEVGFPVSTRVGIYQSDSSAFADKGVPALSFARTTGSNFGQIHCRYDLADVLSMEQLKKDIDFITLFTERMANSMICPVSRELPEKVKKELDEYMGRKRKDS